MKLKYMHDGLCNLKQQLQNSLKKNQSKISYTSWYAFLMTSGVLFVWLWTMSVAGTIPTGVAALGWIAAFSMLWVAHTIRCFTLKYKELSEVPYQPCVSPGEIVDRITILEIKAQKLSNEAARKTATIELLVTSRAMGEWLIAHPVDEEKLLELTELLRVINNNQWALEDRVREDSSWAQSARANNTLRVEVKNSINELFDWMQEMKEYEGN